MGGLMAGAWVNADMLSADEANNPGVRQVLRTRSRYECLEANAFLKGAITTVVDVIVGRGPRLQLQLPNPEHNRQIERSFMEWCHATRYAEYLRTLVKCDIVDGAGVGLRTTSSTVPSHLPSLFCRNIEIERMTSLSTSISGPLQVDGIRLNEAGEVVSYFLHTGLSPILIGLPEETPRSQVTHLYRRDRAGQHHGVPWLTPSLPLCNLLRQWTMATVTAARTAAKHSAVLESNANSLTTDGSSIQPLNPFDAEEIDYDMLTALPMGWRLAQMKAEQPTTGYEMFRDCLLGEIVRPLGAPLNVVLGSSAKWNYASTQADRITFANRVSILRHEIEIEELDRTFAAWWDEASLMPGLIPDGVGPLQSIPHRWFWDSLPDADPQTLAQAREIDLRTGHASREQLLHEAGQDIDSHDETAAKSFGLNVEQFRQLLARKTFGSMEVDQVLASSGNQIAFGGQQLQSLALLVSQVSQGQVAASAARALAQVAAPSLPLDQIAAMFPEPSAVAIDAGSGDSRSPSSDQVLVESN